MCDQAVGEVCPVYLNSTIKAHWGLPDPAHIGGEEAIVTQAFQATFDALQERVDAMLALPLEQLSKAELNTQLNLIGSQAIHRGYRNE